MLNICLIDVKGRDDRSIKNNSSVNIRNMVELSRLLNADFFYNAKQLINNKKKYDITIFGFGSISTNIEETRAFFKLSGVKKIFWLCTEYEQSMNPAMYYCCKDSGLKYSIIKNFSHDVKKGKFLDNQYFINLNLLIVKTPNKIIKKKYDCIYYSRWREDRSKYLLEYLQKPIYFSSDVKNFKKHKHIGCNPNYIKKLCWEEKKEELNLFRYSLYIEDEFTHNNFNNLANRWYEASFCNVVMVFDSSCINTIKKSELNDDYEKIKEYIVVGEKDLNEKILIWNNDYEKHLSIQNDIRKNQTLLKTNMVNCLKDILHD